jgi:hypothetical protein
MIKNEETGGCSVCFVYVEMWAYICMYETYIKTNKRRTVGDLDEVLGVDEEIARLHVPVNLPLAVQVVQAL